MAGAAVPGGTLRAILQVMQEVSGRQYPLLVADAGLDRYLTMPPEAVDRAAASDEEMAALYQAVYRTLGPSVTRLFHRNCGLLFAQLLRQGPAWPRMEAEARLVGPERRLEWLVQQMAEVLNQAWSPQQISEDAAAWYMTSQVCYTCQGIHGAPVPICAAGESMCADIAKDLLQRRVRVSEVACAAMGAPACRYAFFKN